MIYQLIFKHIILTITLLLTHKSLFADSCEIVDSGLNERKDMCKNHPITKKRDIEEVKKNNDGKIQIHLLSPTDSITSKYHVITQGKSVNNYISCKEQYTGLNGITKRKILTGFVTLDNKYSVFTEHCKSWGIGIQKHIMAKFKKPEDFDPSTIEVICTEKTESFGEVEVFNKGIEEHSYARYKYLYACTDDELYNSQNECNNVVKKCDVFPIDNSCSYTETVCTGSTICEKTEEDTACKEDISNCEKNCKQGETCNCNKDCPDKKTFVSPEYPECDVKWYDFITLGISRLIRCPRVCPRGSSKTSSESCSDKTKWYSYTDYKVDLQFDSSYIKVRRYDINICLQPVIVRYPDIKEIYDPNIIYELED